MTFWQGARVYPHSVQVVDIQAEVGYSPVIPILNTRVPTCEDADKMRDPRARDGYRLVE